MKTILFVALGVIAGFFLGAWILTWQRRRGRENVAAPTGGEVGLGFVTNFFGFHRNHYDRVAHFSVGFYAYAIAEALVRTKAVRSRLVLFLFPIFAIGFVAMSYELIEWIYAENAGGPSGAAFLGSQGDIWDAQKDMLSDTLGAIVATLLYFATARPAIAKA